MDGEISSLLQKLGEDPQVHWSALNDQANQRLEHILNNSLCLHQTALFLTNQIDKITSLINFRKHSLVLEHLSIILKHLFQIAADLLQYYFNLTKLWLPWAKSNRKNQFILCYCCYLLVNLLLGENSRERIDPLVETSEHYRLLQEH